MSTTALIDVFIAKYDSDGRLKWVNQLGGRQNSASEEGIAFDAQGNCVVTAAKTGEITIGSTTLPAKGDYDVVVASYDSAGKPRWATQAGGAGGDVGLALGVDSAGNVFATGRLSPSAGDSALFGTISLAYPPFSPSPTGVTKVFVARLDVGPRALEVGWTLPPPSSVIAGQAFQVAWTISGSPTHVSIHWDPSDPKGLTPSQAVPGSTRDSTTSPISSPLTLTAPTKYPDGTPITASTTVYYVVHVSNAQGEDAYSTVVPVTVEPKAPPATVGLIIEDTNVVEGNTGTVNAEIVVTLVGETREIASVSYSSASGTAKAGSDFQTVRGSLTFNPGESSKTILVPVLGGLVFEPDETFTVTLSNPVNATLTRSTATVTISNDDPPPVLQVLDTTVREGDSGDVEVVFTVNLTGLSAEPVRVSYTTVDGTALAAQDYTSLSGVLEFTASGATIGVQNVPALPRMNIAWEEGAVVISWNSGAGSFQLESTGVLGAGAVWMPVDATVSSAGEAQSVRVTPAVEARFYRLAAIVATPGGSVTRTVATKVHGDLIFEPDETFSLKLSNPVNATLGRAEAVATILNDDILNQLPLVSLTAPGAALIAPASVPLAATANDPDGQIARVEFYSGATKIGEDSLSPFEFSWPAVAAGTYVLTAKAFDNEGASTISAPVAITVRSPQVNEPPQVRLISPQDEDTFPADTSVILLAQATDPDGQVTQVDFYADTQLLGTERQAPFTFAWKNPAQGVYQVKAVARDDRGAVGESAVARVTIRANDGRQRVAIVQNLASPEVSKLQAWLADLDLSSRIFDKDGLTFAAVQGYDLVVWADSGTTGLTDNVVSALSQVANSATPLYFLGGELARSTADLSPATQDLWTRLVRLKAPATDSPGDLVQPVEESNPILNGPFGLVGQFRQPAGFDLTTALRAGEKILAQTAQTPVVLASDENLERTVTQNAVVLGGSGPNALIQKEKLFKNAVWWLLRFPPPPPFLNLSVTAEAQPASLAVGGIVTLTVTVQHGGELGANGLALTVALPAGIDFLEATGGSGASIIDEGVVICPIESLSRSESVTLTLTLRVISVGVLPLSVAVSANQPEAQVNDNRQVLTLTVTPP